MEIGEKITHEGIEAELVVDQRCSDCCFYDLECPTYKNGDLICILPDSDVYGTFKEVKA